MIEAGEIAVLMKSVASVVREYVSVALGAVTGRVDKMAGDLEAVAVRVAGIPAGEKGDPGKDAPPVDVLAIAADVLAKIPIPANGRDGAAGIAGKDGTPGVDGKDGSSIIGATGRTGDKGEPGERGPAGEKGEPGISIKGEPGERGEKGLDGRDGREGKDGRDGADGLPGRDALQVEILPMIDESKSYPRGTVALHRGGTIRASRNTGPILEGDLVKAGWEVTQDGIAGFHVEQHDDLRTFSVLIERTSGPTEAQVFKMPTLIYREIYKEGTDYFRGDVVTFGGSAWHCQSQTKSKPGESETWRLMIKHGAEGKKGGDGKPGERGKDGAPGKDLTQIDYSTGAKH